MDISKPTNISRRTREYLTPQEVDKLIKAASQCGRYPHRDATMLLIAYRHALRVSELVNLRWSQVDLEQAYLHVNRRKNGVNSVQPLRGTELRALRKIKRDYPNTEHVFLSERKAPISADTVRSIIARAGEKANLGMPIHPHMLRHSAGFKFANEGRDTRAIQQYLGHKNIQHTVRYTELAPDRFKNFWND